MDAFAVTLECVGRSPFSRPGSGSQSSSRRALRILFALENLAFRIGGYQHHLLDLAGYLLLLVVLAVALGLAATRAWERVGTPVLDAVPDDRMPTGSVVLLERWSGLDAGVLMAQPVIAFMGALALSVRVDAVPPSVGARSKDQASVSTAILVVGLVTGFLLTGLMWRRMRPRSGDGSRSDGGAVLVAVPWIAFVLAVAGSEHRARIAWVPVISYGPTAPGGRDLGTGFTTVRLAATGQTEPLSVACSDPAHCLAFGLPWDVAGATSYGVVYSTSGGRWHVAPFRLQRPSPTAPFSKNVLTCPGSDTCYAVSLNAPRPAGLAKSTDGGLRWRPIVLPFSKTEPLSPYGLPGIQGACISDHACVLAVPQGFAVTLDGGSSWVNTTLYSSLPVPGGVPARGQPNNYLAGVRAPPPGSALSRLRPRSRGRGSSTTWLFATHDAGRTGSRRPIGPLTARTTGLSVPIFVPSSFACATVALCARRSRRHRRTCPGGLDRRRRSDVLWRPRPRHGPRRHHRDLRCPSRLLGTPPIRGPAGVWRSADGGRHWAEASPLPRGIAFGVPPSDTAARLPSLGRCVPKC